MSSAFSRISHEHTAASGPALSGSGGAELSAEQHLFTRTDAGKRYSKLLPALVKQELREQGEDGKEKQFWRPMGRYRLLQKGVNPKLFGGGGIDELVEKEGDGEGEMEGAKEGEGEGREQPAASSDAQPEGQTLPAPALPESTTMTLAMPQPTILETLVESDCEEDEQLNSKAVFSFPLIN